MRGETLLFTAGSLGRLVRRTLDRGMRSLDLTTSQIRVLLCIAAGDGAIQKDIEDELLLTRASVSATADSLEALGLIVREKVDSDARLRRLVITDEGREKLALARRHTERVEAAMAAALSSEEKEDFMDICRRLRKVLEEDLC